MSWNLNQIVHNTQEVELEATELEFTELQFREIQQVIAFWCSSTLLCSINLLNVKKAFNIFKLNHF